jgi:nucleotide-binding universal stress UspA family protein
MATHGYRSNSPASILVPLDGSVRAEGALPVARQLAQCLGADIVLVRVTPLVTLRFAAADAPLPAETRQQLVDDQRELAHEYLLEQGRLLQEQGISVRAILAAGNTASTLLDICATEQIGMVVMTTHGRTGLARFALGSVADQMVRDSHIPVLLLRSYSSPSSATVQVDATLEKLPAVSWHLDRVLVALDGSELSESALPLVRELAGVVFHHITLQRVLPLSAAVPYRASVKKYLEAQERELRAELAGSPCEVTSRLCDGVVPSEKIVEIAEEEGCLVVMATHGWGGMKRLILGSVTNQVVHTAHVPVLVVHAADQKSLSEDLIQKALSSDILPIDSLADAASKR